MKLTDIFLFRSYGILLWEIMSYGENPYHNVHPDVSTQIKQNISSDLLKLSALDNYQKPISSGLLKLNALNKHF